MPYPIAATSKREIRHDVAQVLGDLWALETSGAGNAGGTTAVYASLTGRPIASVQNRYLLIEEGANDSEWRVASAFAGSSGTITVPRAYTAQVASGITSYLHEFAPDLYWRAANDAARALYPFVYRPITHHAFPRQATYGPQRTLGLPRDMERVALVRECRRTSAKLRDYVDRSNSTTDAGPLWTASVGAWGVTSEGIYCVSDTDGDLLLAATNPQLKNGVIEMPVRGDTTGGASRVLSLLFRYEDGSNYLALRLLNGAVDLRRKFGGTESSLTTASLTTTENVDYLLRVLFDGSWVSVWVDDRQMLLYELTGENLAYLGYDENGAGTFGNIGLRLDKNGSPSLAATATRVGHVFAHALVGTEQRGDWFPRGRSIEFNVRGRGRPLTDDRMLWLDGMAGLSALTADTTFETLASDSTDVLEIQTGDPAYDLLVQQTAYAVLRAAASPAFTSSADKRNEYRERAAEQQAIAERARARKSMTYPVRGWL